MRTLYLHIGMPKAGSTSIQSALHDARNVLEDEGISYLRYGQNHGGVFRFLVGQSRKDNRAPLSTIALQDLGLATADRTAVLTRVAEIARASRSTAVISAEVLFGFTPAEIASVKAILAPHFDRIRIVVYLREPIFWASSRAQQAVKTGRSSEADLIEDLDCRGRAALIVPGYGHLRHYVEAFGRDGVLCRAFDRSCFVDGDLLSDFLTTIGRPDLSGKVRSRISNPSLSHEAVRLLDAFRSRSAEAEGLDPKIVARLCRHLTAIPGQAYALPPSVLRKVDELSRDDIDWLRREFGLDLLRARRTIPEPLPSLMDRHTAEGIADIMIDLARRNAADRMSRATKDLRRKRRGGLFARLARKLGLSQGPRRTRPTKLTAPSGASRRRS